MPLAKGVIYPSTLFTTATLLCGTSNVLLVALFFLDVACRSGYSGTEKPVLNWFLLCAAWRLRRGAGGHASAGLRRGRVLLRYAIVSLPIALMMVAFAMDWLLRLRQTNKIGDIGSFCIVAVLLALFFIAGPLPQIYVSPNDFTSHPAFQGSYAPLTWESSEPQQMWRHSGPAVRKDELSKFYFELSRQPDIQTILEYPYDICCFNDRQYYYQHFHGKRVMVGYADPRFISWGYDNISQDDLRQGLMPVGCSLDLLAAGIAADKAHFRNALNILDAEGLLRSPADVVVLQKWRPVMLMSALRDGQCWRVCRSIGELKRYFENSAASRFSRTESWSATAFQSEPGSSEEALRLWPCSIYLCMLNTILSGSFSPSRVKGE